MRLLTVTGPGGVGKTRLALAAARSTEAAFPQGVWFVDLVPLHDPTLLDAAIVHALHLGDASIRSPRERVTAYLSRRRVLLVLDNFEHVLPAATRVSELLATLPDLKVLVTSREPLNLRLEHRMVLGGLALPSLARPTPEAIAQAASVALFLERARLVRPEFTLSSADARAVAELVHRLDGLPLAIQIAAARINVLSPTAMLTRFQGQGLLSTEEARDLPARHHTLRDTIEWSYAMLDRREQSLFSQLAVFAGGWTLDAAEEIVQNPDPRSPLWPALGSLVVKSLVQTEGVDGAVWRYRMLETIREFALERLATSQDGDTVRRKHAAYYLALAEQAESEMWGKAEFDWASRMEWEHENLRAALKWATDRSDGMTAVRLAGALADFWWLRGYLREGRRGLKQALALGLEVAPQLRVKVLIGAGTIASALGDLPAAREHLRQALELAEADHDSGATALTLARLGNVAAYGGDAREAQALLERSLALGGVAPEQRANTLFILGRARLLAGDIEHAETALAESRDLCRSVGNRRLTASVMSLLARIKLTQGNDAEASALAAGALMSPARGDHSRATWSAVATAALVSAHRGNLEQAIRLLAAGEAWSEWTGDTFIFGSAIREETEQIAARARAKMGESAYRAAVLEGRALSADEAVDLARAGLEPHPDISSQRATTTNGGHPRALLSDREQAVLRLIAEGLLNKQIAASLGIGERTVKTYVTSAMKKLGADNRAHAAVVAVQRGLLQ
jgi:non-specific serine/threonine protein kinase